MVGDGLGIDGNQAPPDDIVVEAKIGKNYQPDNLDGEHQKPNKPDDETGNLQSN